MVIIAQVVKILLLLLNTFVHSAFSVRWETSLRGYAYQVHIKMNWVNLFAKFVSLVTIVTAQMSL